MLTKQALHAELEDMLRCFTRASSVPSTAGVCAATTMYVLYMCPHATTYASAYYYICVLIPLHMRPHTTIYVSSYYYICVRILRTQDLSGIGFHDLTVPDDMWAPLNVGRSSAVLYAVYLLYWYKSTNTDAKGASRC